MLAMRNEDGGITAIYCHYDGYVEGVGRILNEHYQDPEKIKKLLSIGDLSVLAEEIGETNSFDPGMRVGGVCLFYTRDGGEKEALAKKFHNLFNAENHYISTDYYYVFEPTSKDTGVWTFKRGGFKGGYTNLAEYIQEEFGSETEHEIDHNKNWYDTSLELS
jgi:hypothetical protein